MNKKHKNDDGLPRVSFLKTLLKSLEIYFKASPLICVGNLSNAIMLGVGSMLITLFTQRFFDAVSAAAAGSGTLPSLIGPLTALGGAYLAVSLFGGIDGLTYNVMLEKFKTEAVRRVHVKMGRLDPVCLEDARLHDQLEKTAQGADSLQLITGIGVWSVLDHIGYLIFMSAYLSFVSPRLILAMLCVFLPTIIGQLLKMRVKADFEDEAAPIRRRYSFYERSVTHREFFKETRLLGAFSMLLGRFLEACAELTRAELRENRRSRRIEAVITLITALGWCGVIFLLVYSLVRGEITLGVFAAVFTSVETMFEMMEAAFRNIGRVASEFGSAKNYMRFFDLPERGGTDAVADKTCGIELDDVTFTYPNAEKPSIDGVTLRIAPGETVAVVGINGSGKSTLVRLLTGLYKPTSGIVTSRGIDTRDGDADSVFGGVSGVFQRYQRYQLTLSENVKISETDSDAPPDKALRDSGVEVEPETFPNGTDTMLSREFDGVELSGGQWQRLAIARGLYRAHDLIALDEPTAAIDPIEESRIYKKFIEISRGKTAVIVTHRLGSVKTADRVIMLRDGKIVAAAPHAQLLVTCPEYREMYDAQAEWYEDAGEG